MQYAAQSLPVETWPVPPGIVQVDVCDPSGLLPTRYCPSIVSEVFIAGTEPAAFDNLYQLFRINRETGRLATVFTPPELVEERVFLIPPVEAADWARESGVPQPPSEYDTVYDTPPSGDAVITGPLPFGYIHGVVPVTGTARVPPPEGQATSEGGEDNFALYRLQYGAGLNPSQWFQIGADRTDPVENGELGQWDTSALSGLYSLQLIVVRNDQSFAVATVQVTVDNQRPSVTLLQPRPGQQFRLDDESLAVQPEVADNLRVERVEFYVDGARLHTATAAPYAYRWPISGQGEHTLFVRVFDGAGNGADSEPVTVTVR
jgi:hypothetical protein